MARSLLGDGAMTTAKRIVGIGVVIGAVGAVAALGLRAPREPAAPRPAASSRDEVGIPPRLLSAPVPKIVPSHVPSTNVDDAVASLRKGLASSDEAARIAAVERAAAATATSTLPDLERFDLASDPETAPTVIHTIALLGASAEGKERDAAAHTLESWLTSEMKRDTADARGNVSNLVEALGDLGGPDAVSALDAMLDRGDAAIHLQTLAVQKLGDLADGTSRPAVERFAERTAALPPSEGLDEELRVEAIAAARTTLTKL